ncbi:hypothetical protein GCM10023334_127290 [Nonomuraea thailandensis]
MDDGLGARDGRVEGVLVGDVPADVLQAQARHLLRHDGAQDPDGGAGRAEGELLKERRPEESAPDYR